MKTTILSLVLFFTIQGALADDPTVYVARTGHKYHRATCRYVSHSRTPLQLSRALARGYKPCKMCMPPIAVARRRKSA